MSPTTRAMSVLTASLLLLLTLVVPASAETNVSSGDMQVTASERTYHERLAEKVIAIAHNQARRDGHLAGGPSYSDVSDQPAMDGWTDILTVARNWSDTMSSENRMYHNPDFTEQYGHWRGAGENVAYIMFTTREPIDDRRVIDTANQMAGMWWDSTGHRLNWMRDSFDDFAVGVTIDKKVKSYGYQYYFWGTVNFRSHDGSTIDGERYDINALPPTEMGSTKDDTAKDDAAKSKPTTQFSDVPTDHVFYDTIDWFGKQGITQGCGGGKFCPRTTVTRGQMAVFFTRWLNLPPAQNTFSDAEGHMFEDAIGAFAEAGITVGCGKDTFCPNQPVTRGQMATFFARALDLPAGNVPFADAEGHLFERPIGAFAKAGITVGCGKDKFCPNNNVTRGQMATFIYRANKLLK